MALKGDRNQNFPRPQCRWCSASCFAGFFSDHCPSPLFLRRKVRQSHAAESLLSERWTDMSTAADTLSNVRRTDTPRRMRKYVRYSIVCQMFDGRRKGSDHDHGQKPKAAAVFSLENTEQQRNYPHQPRFRATITSYQHHYSRQQCRSLPHLRVRS